MYMHERALEALLCTFASCFPGSLPSKMGGVLIVVKTRIRIRLVVSVGFIDHYWLAANSK